MCNPATLRPWHAPTASPALAEGSHRERLRLVYVGRSAQTTINCFPVCLPSNARMSSQNRHAKGSATTQAVRYLASGCKGCCCCNEAARAINIEAQTLRRIMTECAICPLATTMALGSNPYRESLSLLHTDPPYYGVVVRHRPSSNLANAAKAQQTNHMQARAQIHIISAATKFSGSSWAHSLSQKLA